MLDLIKFNLKNIITGGNVMKKILALVAAVVLTFGTCTTAFAADGADILSH